MLPMKTSRQFSVKKRTIWAIGSPGRTYFDAAPGNVTLMSGINRWPEAMGKRKGAPT